MSQVKLGIVGGVSSVSVTLAPSPTDAAVLVAIADSA